jgi:hypothetical protein
VNRDNPSTPLLDYAPPPVKQASPFWRTLLLRAWAFAAVGVLGWFLTVGGILYWQPNVVPRWMAGVVAALFVGWVFTLVWICRGGWILGVFLGFVCGFSVAGYGGALLGPFLGAIAGAAAMPLTKPPR